MPNDTHVTTPPKPRKLSKKGIPVGRPVTRLVKLKVIPTRCPTSLHHYLKLIHPFFAHTSLLDFYASILNSFMEKKPWERGLQWRKPKSILAKTRGEARVTGWCQVNVQMSDELHQKINNQSLEHGVTKASFIYTAFYWYAQHECPPSKLRIA